MPRHNRRRHAAVGRANNALFSIDLASPSSEEPQSRSSQTAASSSSTSAQQGHAAASSSRTPLAAPAASSASATQTPIVPPPSDKSDENQDEGNGPGYATLDSALQTIVPKIAFEEGKFIVDFEGVSSPNTRGLCSSYFEAAFLYVDPKTASRTWKIDTDIVEFLAMLADLDPEATHFKARKDPSTGQRILIDYSEHEAVESIRTLLLRLAEQAYKKLPKQPDFSKRQIDNGVDFFVYLGYIAMRAFLRGKARLNTTAISLAPETLAAQRQFAMTDQANLIIKPEKNPFTGARANATDDSRGATSRRRQQLANELEGLLAENADLPAKQRRRVWAAARDRLRQPETVAAADRPFEVGSMPGWAGELEAMQVEGLRGVEGKGKEVEKK